MMAQILLLIVPVNYTYLQRHIPFIVVIDNFIFEIFSIPFILLNSNNLETGNSLLRYWIFLGRLMPFQPNFAFIIILYETVFIIIPSNLADFRLKIGKLALYAKYFLKINNACPFTNMAKVNDLSKDSFPYYVFFYLNSLNLFKRPRQILHQFSY